MIKNNKLVPIEFTEKASYAIILISHLWNVFISTHIFYEC